MASLLGQAFPKHPAKGSTSSGSLFMTPATLPASFPSQCEDVQTRNGPAPLHLLFLRPPPSPLEGQLLQGRDSVMVIPVSPSTAPGTQKVLSKGRGFDSLMKGGSYFFLNCI